MAKTFVLSIVGLVAFAGGSWAQEVTGSIFGTVTDPSGAAVPNAKVTVTNTGRDQVLRTLTTDSAGYFSAPILATGIYSVTVEASGFRKSTRQEIELNVNEHLTVNVKLEIGDVTQEVSVTANPVEVELQSAQQSGLISGTMVRELSLNNRQFAQLLALQPGVVANTSDSMFVGTTNPTGGNNLVAFSVNGARQSQNNWTVDGADNVDRGTMITIQTYPSVDAIEEMRIVRSAYSAEFGRAAGGQINVTTKSGTNDFHGVAYEFFRNDKLNANNFFNNANRVSVGPDGKATRPPLRYNDFGYTLGGPVLLPGYNGKNKTFFFWSQEWRRVVNFNASNVQLPTGGEKQGIFQNPVCVATDAAGNCTSTSTQITNINPIARQYIQDIYSKLPDGAPGTNNVFVPLRGVFNSRQELIRGDHTFSPKLQVSARFLHDTIPTVEPGGLFTNIFTPNVSVTKTDSPGRSLLIRGVSALSPTWTNEAGWAWSRGGIVSQPIGLAATENSPNIKVPLPFASTLNRVPTIVFQGGFSTITSYGPYDNFSYNHNFYDNMAKQVGKHNVKFGVQVHIYRKQENNAGNNTGSFTFANTPRPAANVTAQQAWANFLLGNVFQFTQLSRDLTPDLRSKTFETYVQDDFRIRPNLTLNFGLRYSNFRQPTETGGLLTNFDRGAFDPSKAPQIDATTGNRIANTGDLFNGIIRAGTGGNSRFGDKVGQENNHDFAPRFGFAWDPFSDGKTSVRGGYGIFFDNTLVGVYQQNITTNPTAAFTNVVISNTRFENPTASAPTVSLSPAALRGTATDYKTPYVQQWTFEVQRQLMSDSLFTIGYVGSKGTNLIGVVDLNQIRPGLAAAAGLVPANAHITAATTARLNRLRPYPGYNAINSIQSWFNSNYHALQVSYQKRFRGNGTLNFSYTWSKSITDNGSDRSNSPQNTYAWGAERALSPLDRRQVLTAAYVYDLPFFRGQRGLTGHALGGWELSGIVTWNTGLPATVTSSLGNDPGGLGILGASASSPRPDAIGDPYAGSDIKTINKWFNTAAFAEVPVGQYRPGNVGRSVIESPGIVRWDISVFKNFALTERVRLQVRGEMFNALNHANFNAPTVAIGNPNFGRILGARDPRNAQIGLKVIF